MKPKTMILLAVAVGCGLVASYLTSKVLAERGNNPVEVATTKVVVAKKNLPIGMLIKEPEKYFVEKDMPITVAPKKAVNDLTQLKGRKLMKPISDDVPITDNDLLEIGTDQFSQSIPPGHRAMSIRVNQESGNAGFVLPLTRVDVVYTQRGGEAGDSSITLLQDMLVPAADMETSRSPDQPAKVSQTVTLAVKPEEAQKLALAAARGDLRLVLRRPDDKETPQTRKTTPRDVDRGAGDSDPESADGMAAEDKGPNGKPAITVPSEPVAEKKTEPEEKKEPTLESDPELFWVQEIWNGEALTKVIRKKGGSKETDVKVEKSDPLGIPKSLRKPEANSTDKTQEIKVDAPPATKSENK